MASFPHTPVYDSEGNLLAESVYDMNPSATAPQDVCLSVENVMELLAAYANMGTTENMDFYVTTPMNDPEKPDTVRLLKLDPFYMQSQIVDDRLALVIPTVLSFAYEYPMDDSMLDDGKGD